jgi:hypothetical protein
LLFFVAVRKLQELDSEYDVKYLYTVQWVKVPSSDRSALALRDQLHSPVLVCLYGTVVSVSIASRSVPTAYASSRGKMVSRPCWSLSCWRWRRQQRADDPVSEPGHRRQEVPHTGKLVVVDPAELAANGALQRHRHDAVLVALSMCTGNGDSLRSVGSNSGHLPYMTARSSMSCAALRREGRGSGLLPPYPARSNAGGSVTLACTKKPVWLPRRTYVVQFFQRRCVKND